MFFLERSETTSLNSIAFSPDGRWIVSGSDDGMIVLWDLEIRKPLKIFEENEVNVEALAFSPDGRRIASGSNDYTIKIWDVESGKLLKTFEGHKSGLNSVAFSPDGRRIAGSDSYEIILWEIEKGKKIASIFSNEDKWIFIVKGGYHNSSDDIQELIKCVRINGREYDINEYLKNYRNENKVWLALAGIEWIM